ncbi:hypothetical protein SAMN05421847_1577 [Halpernia humi]|uniref:Guanylate cyclase domain-containing protein n=1 Tax=Halpernia humi TaxID=493375 RepID=A0A1H5XVU3_9FLAO|nr:hypothetical protein [Halpernia humi]SEG15919.1 hypothetical protein SAMN05421847_1577 [Halpernia humi]
MPITDFHGDTFVAFTDISGFKELMKNDAIALEALKHFYQTGFNVLRDVENVEGFFVSDCGILFSRGGDVETKLANILDAISKINRKMIEKDYMLTTSISYGHFDYRGKIEFQGIEKNPIYGGAYVQSFLDNETGKPKIQPGQCRLLKKNLPEVVIENIPLLVEKANDKQHLYYYWNLEDPDQIENFESRYRDSYSLKYTGMLTALKS